ncbi:MAG: NUDIX hydrolase [Nanoarchaeota archaeon]
MKPIKNAVAFVIYNPDRTKILVVQRPFDDENLPGVWGLPAGSLKENENYEEAVLRAGREKLGVQLQIIKLINEGEIQRNTFLLHMKEYEIEIIKGQPSVPQPINEVTQFIQWKWALPEALHEAAEKGSLCSQLYLATIKKK